MSTSLVALLRMQGVAAEGLFPETTEAVLSSLGATEPDVVLLDLDLGRLGDGLDLVRPISQMGPALLVLTGSEDEHRHAACLEAGALGVVVKDADFASLLEALQMAARGESLITDAERESALLSLRQRRAREDRRLAAFRSLTDREREVLDAMRLGMSAAVISEELDIAVTTVRSHVRSVLVKLGTSSQLEAVAFASEVGWARR